MKAGLRRYLLFLSLQSVFINVGDSGNHFRFFKHIDIREKSLCKLNKVPLAPHHEGRNSLT